MVLARDVTGSGLHAWKYGTITLLKEVVPIHLVYDNQIPGEIAITTDTQYQRYLLLLTNLGDQPLPPKTLVLLQQLNALTPTAEWVQKYVQRQTLNPASQKKPKLSLPNCSQQV